MVDAGLPEPFANELAALYGAEQDDLYHARGDRRYTCTTGIDQTLRHVVQAATSDALR